jgi:FixJ family two-component response regulator
MSSGDEGGAVEFLMKPFKDDVLLDAIKAHRAQSHSAPRGVGDAGAAEPLPTHSRRATWVMALVVSGLLNKQVGGELGISEITEGASRSSDAQDERTRFLTS